MEWHPILTYVIKNILIILYYVWIGGDQTNKKIRNVYVINNTLQILKYLSSRPRRISVFCENKNNTLIVFKTFSV